MTSTEKTSRKSAKTRRAAVKPKGDKGEAAPRGHAGTLSNQSKRERGASERREAIVAAGLAEFTAKGFANTRLEDVAKRAGVAKGTIYLHFKDKEALFQELVRTTLVPLAARISSFAAHGGSVRDMMEKFAQMLATDVIGTSRGDIVRLLISEGARFPALAEFYHQEVIARGIIGLRTLIGVGIARGEIHNKAFLDYPQLVVAPALAAIVWQGLFGKISPLDATAMLHAHIDIIFTERRAT